MILNRTSNGPDQNQHPYNILNNVIKTVGSRMPKYVTLTPHPFYPKIIATVIVIPVKFNCIKDQLEETVSF